MNIFFTGAIRGGRAQQPEYAAIVAILQRQGTVFSSHVSDDELSLDGETHLSGSEILRRELNALTASDIAVAEVTTPSLGVGYLIKAATAQGRKVIALYKGGSALQLSAIIKGDPMVEVHTYETPEDLEKVLNLGK